MGNRWLRIELVGEIDLAWYEDHRADIETALEDCPPLVIFDVEHVSFMDSTGLGLIARMCQHCRPKDGFVYILKPSATVYKAMDIVGLTRASGIVIADTAAKVADVDQQWAGSLSG